MLKPKCTEAAEKELVFGDYITVHVPGLKSSQDKNAESSDVQIECDQLFQRIHRQRAEVLQTIKKPQGKVIDVRLRTAGASKKGWKLSTEVMDADDKFVA